MAEKINGASVLVQSLQKHGVEYVFGIVGVPVIELAGIAQAHGLKYVGMRNEQAACYAASAIGYLTKRPAVCLTVPGPGLLHVLAGMQNANENCWPLIVISGSVELEQDSMGKFQELNHVLAAQPYSKFSARPSSIKRIPFYVEKAVRSSIYGRPGACFLDIPSDFILKKTPMAEVAWSKELCPEPPRLLAATDDVSKAVDILVRAESPLVIIGKGAAYSRAETSVKAFIGQTGLPFLPTPMGKGLLPDDHELCIAPARSRALQQADVILLLGARLNWMLHFGAPPRFKAGVRLIQVDVCAEELHNNVPAAVALQGDVDSVVQQLTADLLKRHQSFKLRADVDWLKTLREKVDENRIAIEELIKEPSPPMNYYNAFQEIQSLMPRDCFLVTEGSNTMDIARTMLPSYLPRHRLDAGTYGTMGVGAGFAIAAAMWCRDRHPGKRVVSVQGDSAFGFSGMELETVCRYNLPIIFIVINNNGIGFGVDSEMFASSRAVDPTRNLPPSALSPGARYERVMEAFGGKGYCVNTREELKLAFQECLQSKQQAALINVIINPSSGRKTQEFHWLTSKM